MYDDDIEEDEELHVSSNNPFDQDMDAKVHRSVLLLPMAGGKDSEFEERRARLLDSLNNSFGMKADIRYYSNEDQIPELLNAARKHWVQAMVVYPRFL